MYLLEFAGGFVIQAVEFHENSLDKFSRAYHLSNYFNTLHGNFVLMKSKIGKTNQLPE